MKKHIQDTIDMAREEFAKGHRIAACEAALTAARESGKRNYKRLYLAALALADSIYQAMVTA